MTAVNGDFFIDVLEERRRSSDFAWVSRNWSCTSCRYSLARTPQEIKQQVTESGHIQNVIKELSHQTGRSEEDVKNLAVSIVDEMAHNFQFKAIRFFGFVLSKLMKRLYHSILVNKKGIEKVANIASQYPILFLPTHRSYADFLLVSYICFHFDLPVPVIAAGLDFLGLKSISSLLRNSGAFFIRRSFIEDQLYLEIFSEYVKTHIQGCEFPIEFFIEGTRSRTAKSLIPKTGMLQVILGELFSSQIPDITIVPISISYDRTLEENLYAYELLGVPKPKESTKGLIKARKILSEDYGNVYVRFGDPISAKYFFRHYDRSTHNLHPRALSIVTKDEQVLCRDLANHIVRMHQCNLVLSPFPLMCLVIGHPLSLQAEGVHFDHLVDVVFWLEELLKRTGACIFTRQASPSEAIEFQLKLHSNVLELSPELFVSVKFSNVEHGAPNVHGLQLQTLKHSVPSMLIYHYGNQALQVLVHMAMICLAVVSSENKDDIFIRYSVLRKLLQREFVFGRLNAEKDYSHALQSLKEERILQVHGSRIMHIESSLEKLEFLSQILLHFLHSYYVVSRFLLSLSNKDDINSKNLAKLCQVAVEKAITNGVICDYKCLSLDVINNCITFLVSQGAIKKDKRGEKIFMVPVQSEITNVLLDMETFLASSRNSLSMNRVPFPTAKL